MSTNNEINLSYIKDNVTSGMFHIFNGIVSMKKHGLHSLPIDFVLTHEVHTVFGEIVSQLRSEGFIVDITSRTNVVHCGIDTCKYTAIVSWN